MKGNQGKVRLHNFIAVLGSAVFLLFITFTIITLFSDEPLWVPILFFIFSLLGAALIIAFINCRISYDDKVFTTKNFFGIKKTFTYDQVTAIKENMHDANIYMGKKKIMVDEFSVGGIDFIIHLHKKYRTLHGGQIIPKITKDKTDIFNGNVYDASGFLVAYIALGVFILAFATLMIFFVFAPSSAKNTIEHQVVFTSFAYDDEIILTSSDNKIYKTAYWNENHDPSDIASVCDGKTKLTVYSDEVTPKYEEHYYRIKALLYNDNYLITFEETNKSWVQGQWPIILIPIILGFIWGAFVTASIVIGRKPQKYSKKIIRLFFKEGYVKY